jgi:hypothetical protein
MDTPGDGGSGTVTEFPSTGTMKDLTAEDILNANDEVTRSVEVPEWGGRVWVRGLTGSERDLFEGTIIEGRGRQQSVNLKNFRAKLVVASAVKSEHSKERLFGDPSHVNRLGNKSARALQRVFDMAQELSGLNQQDVEQMTAELGKDQNGSSGSDSH